MIGTDIIEIDRIKKALEDPAFAKRVFTEKERLYCEKFSSSAAHYAGRFAAKEAIAKALGTGFGKELAFQDIEILPDTSGAPVVKVQGSSKSIALSISHCKSYAIAFALVRNSLNH